MKENPTDHFSLNMSHKGAINTLFLYSGSSNSGQQKYHAGYTSLDYLEEFGPNSIQALMEITFPLWFHKSWIAGVHFQEWQAWEQ